MSAASCPGQRHERVQGVAGRVMSIALSLGEAFPPPSTPKTERSLGVPTTPSSHSVVSFSSSPLTQYAGFDVLGTSTAAPQPRFSSWMTRTFPPARAPPPPPVAAPIEAWTQELGNAVGTWENVIEGLRDRGFSVDTPRDDPLWEELLEAPHTLVQDVLAVVSAMQAHVLQQQQR
jgi:hypothetical protein